MVAASILSTAWVTALMLSRGTSSFTSASKPIGAVFGGTTFATKAYKSATRDSEEAEISNKPIFNAGEVILDPSTQKGPLKVLFLSADTGGGHRASAESLANQFMIHFPGSTYDLLDIWSEDGVWPYKTLVETYKHLSAHPRQWKFLYHLSNWRGWEWMMDRHSIGMCERKIRKRIASYDPDVIVSVHPAMQLAPIISLRKLNKANGKHVPFFTVVTDLASGHTTWFQKDVEKMYVASDSLFDKARRRGKTPTENIVMSGLPIRNDFAVQAEALGDRNTPQGKKYQATMKEKLGITSQKPMILLMGGGEGVGSLEKITDELYFALNKHGVDATICVVCGRNEKLKNALAQRDWGAVLRGEHKVKKRGPLSFLSRRRHNKAVEAAMERHAHDKDGQPGKVDVMGLGFITNMAEYMVASDVLVSKAGPGTIAEAAAVGLPVMLTSFLPGQEAGNVDFVIDNKFGEFSSDPVEIGEMVSMWLRDEPLMHQMSAYARETGHPNAAAEIVVDIGSITHTWMALNAAKPFD